MSLTVSFQQARQENGAVDDLLEANKVLTFTLHMEDFGKLSCAARASRHAVSSQAQIPVFRRKETTPPLQIRDIPKNLWSPLDEEANLHSVPTHSSTRLRARTIRSQRCFATKQIKTSSPKVAPERKHTHHVALHSMEKPVRRSHDRPYPNNHIEICEKWMCNCTC